MGTGYKRAFLQCLLLFCVGVVLQILFGDVPADALKMPWSIIVALNYSYILVIIYALRSRVRWIASLFDTAASVAVMTWMMLLCIIFGLVPQNPNIGGIVGDIGLSRMSHSYPFCLMLGYMITTLGLKAVDDIYHWRQQRLLTLLLHSSVFVALAVSFISGGDKERVKMVVPVGHTVHQGYDVAKNRVQLPFAISLEEFVLEEYPPTLTIYDVATEQSSREHIVLGEEQSSVLSGYEVDVEEYLSMALPDSLGYKAAEDIVGAAPAARIVVRGEVTESRGWVTAGSFRVEPRAFVFAGHKAVVMLPQEPKRYLSRITVTEGERVERFDVEVNSPAKVGEWYIYQSGYDTERGRWSQISIFECVRDGWYPVAKIALWVILVAGCMMLVQHKPKRGEE